MARIAGVDIPRDKRVVISLTYIFGIGRSTAEKVLAEAGVSEDTRVRDLTEEEFRKLWPEGSKCPILGHKMRLYPKEERGIWKGGRHYPYTPTIDHVDPRMPMNKENMQIICWRANELKGDSIPEEIELLYRNLELRDDRYWKGSFMDIVSSGETKRLKQKLHDNRWVGKYTGDRKL